MAQQSIEEISAILTAFEKSQWFPKNLAETEHNLNVVRRAIEGKRLDLSVLAEIFDQLTKAGRLEFISQQAPKVVEKIVEVRSRKDIQREQHHLENLAGMRGDQDIHTAIDATFEENPKSPAELRELELRDRATAAVEQEIKNAIGGHSAMHGGRIHHGKTQERREGLRKIEVRTSSGKRDPKATLLAVRAQIKNYPD